MDDPRIGLLLVMVALAAVYHAAVAPERHGPRDQCAAGFTVVKLKGLHGDAAYLALTFHDISIAGFANRTYHWHVFPGNEHLLPTATLLPFGNSYGDLIGGLDNVPGLLVGRASAWQAVQVLSNYVYASESDDDGEVAALKRELAKLTVIYSEATRLTSIREVVSGGWDDSGSEVSVPVEHLPYIEHWDTMSFELIRWDQTGVWSGPFTEVLRKEAKIHNAKEAFAVVNMLVNRTFLDLLLAHGTLAGDS